MPASSVGALNAWGVYLVASVALVLVLGPLLMVAARGSREGADWRSADGVRTALDALQPGVRLSLSYGPASDQLQLTGHRVICSYGGGTITLPVRWALPNITLRPSVNYLFWLSGDEVQVIAAG